MRAEHLKGWLAESDSPPDLFLFSIFTASSISSSIGTELSTSAGVTVTEMFSLGDDT